MMGKIKRYMNKADLVFFNNFFNDFILFHWFFFFVLNLGLRRFIHLWRNLRDDLNANVQVERLFRFAVAFLVDAADF